MGFRISTRLLGITLAVGFFHVHAEDWPRFLGPNGDGTSNETGLLKAFPKDGPNILWSREIGSGYSAPSIVGDTIILFHRLGKQEVIERLDAKTGSSKWSHAYDTSYVDPYGYSDGPRCTPLVDGASIYTFGAEGKLTCVRLDDGQKVWQRDTAKDFEIPEAFFGVGSTPLLVNNLLIVMIGGQPNSGIVAFDKTTGRTVWESVGESNWADQPMHGWRGERTVVWKSWWKQASYASPVLATVHGKPVLYCFMRQGLVALDPNTGKVFDSFWFRATVEESVNAINPVISGNQILISAAYYKVGSVLLELSEEMKLKEVWRNTNLEIHWSTPTLHEGNVYAFSGRNPPDGSFRCIDFKTGKLLWERNESWRSKSPPPAQFGRGSTVKADGKMIALGECGLLGLFNLNAEKPDEISRWQVPEMVYPCWTAPVLSNKRLYLRCEGRLISLDFSGGD